MVAGVLALAPAPARADAVPQRIVSLNLCVDQVLVDLVPRERIAAVTHLAADPQFSPVAEKARGIAWTYGEAEVVLAFNPDLVLAGEFTTPATVELLTRLGIKIIRIPHPSDIAGVRTATLQVADAVGERAKAEALLAEFDRRVRVAAPPTTARRPTAVVYQVNNIASGPGSLADSVLKAAGFANLASVLGLGSGGQLPLEALVAHPPDVIVLTGAINEYRTAVAENLRHPALAALMQKRRTVTVPWRVWLCATTHLADAIEQLAAVRKELDGRPALR
jgi:iron complex transport system substrate-binding protein